MQRYEIQLIQAIAQLPTEAARYLMSPQSDLEIDWFESVLARKFFSSVAELAISNSNVSLMTILLHRDSKLGAFTPEDVKQITEIWKDALKAEKIELAPLVRHIKVDVLRQRADRAIGKYHGAVNKEPQKVVEHIDTLGGNLAVLSHSGVEYDPNPAKHLEEPTMAMRGSWGANSILDKMFSRDNTEATGGKPAYGLAIASLPTGAGKCVSKDTIIFTGDGAVEIERYATGNIGFSPKTIEIDSGGLLLNTTHFYDSGIQPTKTIKTRHGFSVKGTLNHPVLTLSISGEYVWKELSDISVGDFVAISRKSSVWGNNDAAEKSPQVQYSWAHKFIQPGILGEDDAYIFGALIGNGTMGYSNSTVLTEIDQEVIDKFTTWANKFGENVGPQGKYGYRICGVNLRKWLVANGIGHEGSTDKEIPFTIMRGSETNVKSFIRGLFDTDGGSLRNGYIEWSSSSERLAKQVHLMLSRFGIIGKIRTKKTYAHDSYTITINGENAKRFYGIIGFGVARKQARSVFLPEKRNTNIDIVPIHISFPDSMHKIAVNDYWVYYTGKHKPSYAMLSKLCAMSSEMNDKYSKIIEDWYFWDEILECYDSGDEHCYDVTVPESHSFVTNGIISHNSTLAITMAAYALAYSNDKVVIMSNELVRAIYATAVFRAMKHMYAGQQTDDEIKSIMTDRLAIYAPSSSKEPGINVNSFEAVRRILYWEKPQFAVMDSINGVSSPQFASRMSEQRMHEVKADGFRDTCLEFNLLMYAPGNMSEEHQRILKGNKPDKLQSVMLFGSTAYQNAADWCYLGWRDFDDHWIVHIKRTKNRHGTSLGERWPMIYDKEGGYYRPTTEAVLN